MKTRPRRREYTLREMFVVMAVIGAILAVLVPAIRVAREDARRTQCGENHGINNPLQSPHPGGLLVGLVDGSVPFLTDHTDLALFLRFAIRHDGQLMKNAD